MTPSTTGWSNDTGTVGSSRRSTASAWNGGNGRTPRGSGARTTPRCATRSSTRTGSRARSFADGDSVTGQESPPFGAGLAAGQITDPELAFAGARAHNRWLVEFCATNPARRAGVALVPVTHDIDRAVAEVESLACTPGIRGVMIPTMWHDHPSYGHPDYEPFWAACAAARLMVHTHSGEGDWPAYNDNLAQFVLEVPFWTHRPLWQLLLSGRSTGIPTDVSDEDSVAELADRLFDRHGRCDLAFLNAGVTSGGGGLPWEQEPNDWRWCFGVNVFGVGICVSELVPRMIASGAPAQVVITSSGDGGFAPVRPPRCMRHRWRR